MRNPLLIAAAALLAFPSCRPAGDAARSGEAMAEDGVLVDGPTGKSGDPVARETQRTPAPSNAFLENVTEDTPTPSPLPTMIPDQFHGRWGLVPADCEGGAAAKGLLTIDDRRLVFYESRGVLDRINSNDPPGRLVANFGYQGEGMSWEREETLTLSGGRLERRSDPLPGSGEPAVALTYTRCPA